MKILREGLDLGAFFEELSTARERLLLLDYDGTLAPFTVGREKAFPYPGVPELLDRIIAGGRTRIVIISGRAIADLIPLMGFAKLPEIWGCHGWERRTAKGEYLPPDLTDALKKGLAEAVELAEDAGLADRMEHKPASVAMHWRGMPEGEVEGLRQRILSCWADIAQASELNIRTFDGGIELRPPGRDKGSAVAAVLAESGAPHVRPEAPQPPSRASAAVGPPRQRPYQAPSRGKLRPSRAPPEPPTATAEPRFTSA